MVKDRWALMQVQSDFLEWLKDELGVKNDAALSRKIGVNRFLLSKYRHGRLKVGSTLILRAHEVGGIPVAVLRGKLA